MLCLQFIVFMFSYLSGIMIAKLKDQFCVSWCVHTDRHRHRHPDRYKMGCIEFCGGVDTALRQTSSQIPIGHCSDCIGLVLVSVSVSGSVNTPLLYQGNYSGKFLTKSSKFTIRIIISNTMMADGIIN